MKIELKELVGTKWQPVKADRLLGSSLVNFMVANESPLVSCIYENDQKIMIVANKQEHVDLYKDKLLTFSALDLQILCGEQIFDDLIINTFPDSSFLEVRIEQAGLDSVQC